MQSVESDGGVAKRVWRGRYIAQKAHHRMMEEESSRVMSVDVANSCRPSLL